MELYKEWQELNEHLFQNQSLKNEEIMNAITSESSSAINKIKKGLKMKSYWCLLFVFGFTIMMILARDNIGSVVAIGVVNLMYIIGFFQINKESKRMDSELAKDINVLDSMKRNARLIERSINFERNFFVFGAQVIVLCTMFYRQFGMGETFEMLINDTGFLTFALVACIVSVPFVYFVGQYLNNKSFGPYISELKTNINKLEGVEFLKNMQ